ncbi:MAG: glycosyltransferase family 2 protein [Synergistaceae bacterium]|jgi:glycosyltransferase involved in cell wall biosynthesis|nr:glycosyltransferase family 2 protein [Synergistaceae bacterium]
MKLIADTAPDAGLEQYPSGNELGDIPGGRILGNFGKGTSEMSSEKKIVVAIPCYNEEFTIAKVVSDFKKELPWAEIVVLDNRSTDNSADRAREAGATVVFVPKQGKGAVVRHIFREIDADIYVMVDGDDACPAEASHDLIRPIADGVADMSMGDRLTGGDYYRENKRRFHGFGNELVRTLVNVCFKAEVNDVMCGYRAFSKRFAVNIPILSDGFEVETEMTIRCLDRKLPFVEVPIAFRDRPKGSVSKLNTFRDGFRILLLIFSILKDYHPLAFFSALASVALLAGLLCGAPTVSDFIRLGYTPRVPLAVLASALVLVASIFFICAFILDTMVSHERQRNELNLLWFKERKR